MDIFITVLSGILILTAFVVIHEAGHYWAAKKCGIEVDEFSIGFGPKIFSWKNRHNTWISFRAILFGGYVKFMGDDDEPENNSFLTAKLWKRAVTIVAGPFMNFLAAFILAVIFLCAFGDYMPAVAEVAPGSPAEEYGLMPGDIVTEMNGVSIEMFSDITAAKAAAEGDTMSITISRNGENINYDIPYAKSDDGSKLIGIDSFAYARCTYSFFDAVAHAFRWLWSLVEQLFGVLGGLFATGQGFDELAGPVGTISIIGDIVKTGLENILRLASLISINLAVMNMLPFPSLDGGKLVLYAVEGVRRKPVSIKVEGMLNMIGFALLIAFAVMLTFQDIGRLFGG